MWVLAKALNIVELFLSSICHFLPFFLFFNFLEHIFEHIKGPLSGLFYISDKSRTKEIRGGAFSIHPSVHEEKLAENEKNGMENICFIFGFNLPEK